MTPPLQPAQTADTLEALSRSPHRETSGDFWIPRAHLIAGPEGAPVTLIEAGPGYGKTALLRAWREASAALGLRVVHLDGRREAADTEAFWAQVAKACPASVACALKPGTGVAVGDRLRKLAETVDQLTILIDDYHRISNPSLDQIVSEAAAVAPPGWRLVIASREDILIPFGARRLGGGVRRLSEVDLVFSAQELDQAFAGELAPQDLTWLYAWTEGWPTAVKLARSSLGAVARGDSNLAGALARAEGELGDYLADEALRDLTPVQLTVLRETAFLESFNSDLAEAVTGVPDVWGVLESLSQARVLRVVGSGEDRRYGVHGILRRRLHAELLRRGRRYVAQKEGAAAAWLRANGDLLSALPRARAAGDFDEVAALVLDLGATMFGVSHGALALSGVMAQVPSDVLSRFPRLELANAYLAAKAGDVDTAAEIVRSAKRRTGAGGGCDDPLFARDLAIVGAAISTYGGQGLSRAATRRVETIEAASPGDGRARALINNLLCIIALNASDFPEALSRGASAMHFYAIENSANGMGYAHLHLGRVVAEMGETAKAVAHYHAAHAQFLKRQEDRSIGLASMFLAQALYDQGLVTEALQACPALEPSAEMGGYSYEGLYAGYRTMAMSKLLADGASVAMRELDAGISVARTRRMFRLEALLSLEQVLLEPDPEVFVDRASALAAPAWDEMQQVDEVEPWRLRDLRATVAARLALEQGSEDAAMDRLQRQAKECERQGRTRTHIDLLVRIALLHGRMKRRDRALATLRRALGLARKGRIVAPIFENGTDAIALLTLLGGSSALKDADPAETSFITHAVRVCSDLGSRAAAVFSPREAAVLHLLAQGLNNKLIARALDISPETVRFHLKAIYQKFGLNNGYANRRVVADFATARRRQGPP